MLAKGAFKCSVSKIDFRPCVNNVVYVFEFNFSLLDRVQSEDLAWKESGAAFISSITRLLERLLDYRSVIEGDENRDKRMSCTFNLLVDTEFFFLSTLLSFLEFLQKRI